MAVKFFFATDKHGDNFLQLHCDAINEDSTANGNFFSARLFVNAGPSYRVLAFFYRSSCHYIAISRFDCTPLMGVSTPPHYGRIGD